MSIMRYANAILVATALLVAPVVSAETDRETQELKRIIEQKLMRVSPKFRIETFKPAPFAGFYTVQIENGPRLYVEKSGNHFFDGTLFDISSGKIVNLTEQEETLERVPLLKEFNPADMIIFSPKAPVKTKARIYVFTDVDCFYCQKLHKEMPELNARGIEVRYLAFPRAGIGSPSYDKIVSAWCSADKQTSLTRLKNREEIPAKTCNNPVAKQYDLGVRMGVRGTPAIILENGTMIPGYKPAAELANLLGI